jgi:hypothetical protein
MNDNHNGDTDNNDDVVVTLNKGRFNFLSSEKFFIFLFRYLFFFLNFYKLLKKSTHQEENL